VSQYAQNGFGALGQKARRFSAQDGRAAAVDAERRPAGGRRLARPVAMVPVAPQRDEVGEQADVVRDLAVRDALGEAVCHRPGHFGPERYSGVSPRCSPVKSTGGALASRAAVGADAASALTALAPFSSVLETRKPQSSSAEAIISAG
jgi:hypothetical protein